MLAALKGCVGWGPKNPGDDWGAYKKTDNPADSPLEKRHQQFMKVFNRHHATISDQSSSDKDIQKAVDEIFKAFSKNVKHGQTDERLQEEANRIKYEAIASNIKRGSKVFGRKFLAKFYGLGMYMDRKQWSEEAKTAMDKYSGQFGYYNYEL